MSLLDIAFLLASAAPLFLAFALAVFSSREATQEAAASARSAQDQLAEGRARHTQLKAAVQNGQREESQSLQVYGVAKALAEALSWNDMAPRLTGGIQKIFGAYEFLLYALGQDGAWSLLHRRGNWTKTPPITPESTLEPRIYHPPQVPEIIPVIAAPISINGEAGAQVNGLLFIKHSDLSRPEAELLSTAKEFGEQLGAALRKALLFSQMEAHSRIDGLTGALRRQAFMDRLDEELKRAGAFRTPFSLMMVDIDHFKSVNDTHGHAAGDAVLTRVGEILQKTFYETDVVGRYGGEEFIVLLPRAQKDGVYRKAEGLRQALERESISCGFEKLSVTISIGLSHYPEHGTTAESLIGAADRALYQAKETGRNRVVAA